MKKAAAMSDPEWREAAQAEPEVGLKIWRIEASVASCAYFVVPFRVFGCVGFNVIASEM